jgi:hypothetical protein
LLDLDGIARSPAVTTPIKISQPCFKTTNTYRTQRDEANANAERIFGPKLKAQSAYLTEAEQKIEELTLALEKAITNNCRAIPIAPMSDMDMIMLNRATRAMEDGEIDEELPGTPTTPPPRRLKSQFASRMSACGGTPKHLSFEQKDNDDGSQSSLSSPSSNASYSNSATEKQTMANAAAQVITLEQQVDSLTQMVTTLQKEKEQVVVERNDAIVDLTNKMENDISELHSQIEVLIEKASTAEQRAAASEEIFLEHSVGHSTGSAGVSSIGDELVLALRRGGDEVKQMQSNTKPLRNPRDREFGFEDGRVDSSTDLGGEVNQMQLSTHTNLREDQIDAQQMQKRRTQSGARQTPSTSISSPAPKSTLPRNDIARSNSPERYMRRSNQQSRSSVNHGRLSSCAGVTTGGFLVLLTRILFPDAPVIVPKPAGELKNVVRSTSPNKLKRNIKMHSPTKNPFSFL